MLLDDVHVRYGRRGAWVLQGLTVRLEAGDTIVVDGRNGSGKSTLLRTLAGLMPVSAGRIVDRPGPVAWIPEVFPSDQPFTVQEYLQNAAELRGIPDPDPMIDSLAERLALEPFFDSRLGELSKGSVRKVALVQALLAEPKLLVADEPWDGLDAESQRGVLGLLNEVTQRGGICVLTDHNARYGKRLKGVQYWEIVDGELNTKASMAREER